MRELRSLRWTGTTRHFELYVILSEAKNLFQSRR